MAKKLIEKMLIPSTSKELGKMKIKEDSFDKRAKWTRQFIKEYYENEDIQCEYDTAVEYAKAALQVIYDV